MRTILILIFTAFLGSCGNQDAVEPTDGEPFRSPVSKSDGRRTVIDFSKVVELLPDGDSPNSTEASRVSAIAPENKAYIVVRRLSYCTTPVVIAIKDTLTSVTSNFVVTKYMKPRTYTLKRGDITYAISIDKTKNTMITAWDRATKTSYQSVNGNATNGYGIWLVDYNDLAHPDDGGLTVQIGKRWYYLYMVDFGCGNASY